MSRLDDIEAAAAELNGKARPGRKATPPPPRGGADEPPPVDAAPRKSTGQATPKAEAPDRWRPLLERHGWHRAHDLGGQTLWDGPDYCGPPFTAQTGALVDGGPDLLRVIGPGAPEPFARGKGYPWGSVLRMLRTGRAPADVDGYAFDAVDSRTFFTADYRLRWLVQRVLVANQPGVLGGPKKSLKTSVLIDLMVSLASGTPFLGKFRVYNPCRVLLVSGESGEAVIQQTARNICAARGLDPRELPISWGFRLPQVSSPVDREKLLEGIVSVGAGVVALDPLYLCLLAGEGGREVEASNLYQIGPLLLDLARCILDAGATPLLIHHTRKNLANPFEPLDLEDLAFSGISEFSRQWVLQNRREPYDPDAGVHKLWLSAGGSAGHSGCWAVDVDEGVMDDDFGGKKWDVRVVPASEARAEGADEQLDKKEQARRQRVKDDGSKVLAALEKLADESGWAAYNKVRDVACLNGPNMTRAAQGLVDEGVVELGDYEVTCGKNGKTRRKVQGIGRHKRGETDHSDHSDKATPSG